MCYYFLNKTRAYKNDLEEKIVIKLKIGLLAEFQSLKIPPQKNSFFSTFLFLAEKYKQCDMHIPTLFVDNILLKILEKNFF